MNQANRGDLIRNPTLPKLIQFLHNLRSDPTALWYFWTIHDTILFPFVKYLQFKSIKEQERQERQRRKDDDPQDDHQDQEDRKMSPNEIVATGIATNNKRPYHNDLVVEGDDATTVATSGQPSGMPLLLLPATSGTATAAVQNSILPSPPPPPLSHSNDGGESKRPRTVTSSSSSSSSRTGSTNTMADEVSAILAQYRHVPSSAPAQQQGVVVAPSSSLTYTAATANGIAAEVEEMDSRAVEQEVQAILAQQRQQRFI